MNWDLIEGKWKELRGNVRSKWGKLTDDDFESAAGKKDQLVGRIQQRYGLERDAAEAEVDNWVKGI